MAKTKEVLFNSRHPRLRCLSNFYAAPFVFDFRGGLILVPTLEHAYQLHKTKDKEFLGKIYNSPDASKAKYWGSAKSGCPIIEGFDDKRIKLMRKLLRYKFAQNPMLHSVLKQTKGYTLIEEAPWDDFFGNGKDGKGKNHLGKELMALRDDSEFDITQYIPKFNVKELKVY